jgi:voltage-gated potassium channel
VDDARRERLLDTIERWTEWPQTILALALIPILLIPHLFDVSASTRATLDDLDYLIWGLFLADLLVSVAVAPRRLTYLRTHWFDVVLVALPMIRPLRAARSFRLMRALSATDRVMIGARKLFMRRGLHYIMISAVVIIATAGASITILERDVDGGTIRSFPDGLWWAVTTVTTVGYGDTYPKTAMGRGLGVALMLIGVGLFGVITANLSAFFIEDGDDHVARQLEEMSDRLSRMEALLQERVTRDRDQGPSHS